MQIIMHEIRKILNWKMIFVLAIVNLILYYFLIDFDIKHFPNGRPTLDSYRIGMEMVENYGTTMDEAELKDFKQRYSNKVQEAKEFMQSREDFKELGIQSYEDFRNMDMENEAAGELRNKIMFEDKVDLFWELQEYERLIEFHDHKDLIRDGSLSHKQQERMSEIISTGQNDLFPEVAFSNFQTIIINIAITILLSVLFIISPIFLKDRVRQTVALQYTAKIGRSLFMKKVVAGLISVFIVVSGLLAVYLSIFSLNKTSMFFRIPVNSFIASFYWYDLTFFQYILLTVIAIYVIGFVMALIAMGISNLVPNYIALIGVQVPIVFGLIAFGLHYLLNLIVSAWLPQWVVPVCYAALLIFVFAFVTILWRREKKIDII